MEKMATRLRLDSLCLVLYDDGSGERIKARIIFFKTLISYQLPSLGRLSV